MQDSALLHQTLLMLHFIGLAFGLGGAAVADFFFFKAIKMGDRITPETVARMRSISNVVWVGIGLLSISGLALFLLKPSYYMASPGFLAKMVFVGILVVNGLFLNFYTTARLTTFNFSEIYTRRDAAWKARKLSFVFGAISTVSWYAALLTALFKDVIKLPFYGYILIYILALLSAIFGALVLELILHSRRRTAPLTIAQLTTPPTPLATPSTVAPAPVTSATVVPPAVSPAVIPTPQAAPQPNLVAPVANQATPTATVSPIPVAPGPQHDSQSQTAGAPPAPVPVTQGSPTVS